MTSDQDVSQLYDNSVAINPGQTRLLRLHRDSAIDPLEADLIVVSIGSKGAYFDGIEIKIEYTALSYTWGNGPFSHHITINGVLWRIKEGLYDFLRQHRFSNQLLDRETQLYLWVDALVINQADASEKSHQVANMIEFYDKASHVQVWLGKAAEHSADAISFLHHLLADTQRKNKTISDNALLRYVKHLGYLDARLLFREVPCLLRHAMINEARRARDALGTEWWSELSEHSFYNNG
jgi:hypothetical protein